MNEIVYRGWTIRRQDDVPVGCYGRYTIFGHKSFTTLREAKAYIDQQLNR